MGFAGITDRTVAGELTGSWLSIDSSQLPETSDPDEFRDHELIGLSVRTSAGDLVGEVTGGMDAVDAIEQTPTGAGDKPVDAPSIESIELG